MRFSSLLVFALASSLGGPAAADVNLPTKANDTRSDAPWLGPVVIQPLRLSLAADVMGDVRKLDECVQEAGARPGAGVFGWQARGLSIGPRLTLAGFWNNGCGSTGGGGAGFVYEVPVSPAVSLLTGLGFYKAPATGQIAWQPRVDVLWRRPSMPLSIGLGPRGLSMGGIW